MIKVEEENSSSVGTSRDFDGFESEAAGELKLAGSPIRKLNLFYLKVKNSFYAPSNT
jgi:hypothetical protein